MDRARLERCLERVVAYRESGLKASVLAEANGVRLRDLASWCAHAGRWRARLDGAPASARVAPVSGFVAAQVAPAVAATVHIQVHAGATRVELQWPVAHPRELAAWLR